MNAASQPEALLDLLGQHLGRPLQLDQTVSSPRGAAAHCFTAKAGRERVFIKISCAEQIGRFKAEAEGLAVLAEVGTHRVPEALSVGTEGDLAWLVMDWLDLRPLAAAEDGVAAGRALAELHRQTAERFGWPKANFIGTTPQENGETANWPRFFAEQRLLPQLALAEQAGHPRDFIAQGRRLAEQVPAFFVDHKPAASLLHGDLWHGNAAMADGRPALFDPAVYYGDREADLAMTELFGGFPLSFYAAYREAFPLAAGFETRKALYNLYHVLNHLNLFGRGYLNQAQRMIRALLAEVQR